MQKEVIWQLCYVTTTKHPYTNKNILARYLSLIQGRERNRGTWDRVLTSN